MKTYKLNINGQPQKAEVDQSTPLLWVLRDTLGLTGTKFGCGKGLCGACTVHVDGQAVRSCVLTISQAEGKKITTIEGLSDGEKLTPLQSVWCDLDVAQCGYCQGGQLMSATALLQNNPSPTDEDIDKAMAGNICRCAAYTRIKEAIKTAASK